MIEADRHARTMDTQDEGGLRCGCESSRERVISLDVDAFDRQAVSREPGNRRYDKSSRKIEPNLI